MASRAHPPNGRIVVVFGASRGLGKAVALRLAQEGYAVGVAAKTTENPQAGIKAKYHLEGSIEGVVREIEAFGGLALPLPWDAVTSTTEFVAALLNTIAQHFPAPKFYPHSVIYNAGALSWLSVPETTLKKFDLLMGVNGRGSFIVVKEALQWLRKAEEFRGESADWTPKIVVVSPPIYKRFLRGKIAYAMSKIPMTAMIMSLPIDIKRNYPTSRITPCSLWPGTSVESAATTVLSSLSSSESGNSPATYLRKPEIWSDTILAILSDDDKESLEGRPLIDDDYLRERWGFKDGDFVKYRLDPNIEPRRAVPKKFPNLTVAEEEEELIDTRDLAKLSKVFGKGSIKKPANGTARL
ncbi:uncharacterized protein EI90DRAFT_3154310 [Cantharellus anzutake]|uniref:uncharacterized protein n=1 Tax=Cantharellus anzutake TaxID=1750568 RepID=UPI001906A0BC|nr:uncharacterized protein EI90DRAFT_3154310 [Cantharellus anzutake]KAF8331887.1 hypothetical protein EI90DRAFT_3154310 [Cantharellus anzutake]